MEATVFGELARRLENVKDTRRHNRLHPLASIITIAVVAVLSGADGWSDVASFAELEERWLRLFVPLPHGIPSRQTFERVFARLKPEALEQALSAWFSQMNRWSQGALKHVALDGKALRHSYKHVWDESGMAYLVSAYASENGLVLAQKEAQGKGQELGAIRQLLKLVSLEGCMVTIDALGCQKDVARTIVAEGGNYCLAVKENQPALHRKLKALLDEGMLERFAGWDAEMDQTTDGGHGRIDTRTVWVSGEIKHLGEALLRDWPDLAALAVVESRREVLGAASKATVNRRYYILSCRPSAAEVQRIVRGHWGIENGLHHILDVSYREDASRIRTASAGNFSRLRRLSLNMLKLEKSTKASVAGKRQRCGWSREYRVRVLATAMNLGSAA
jgi:predicted transposase YbfD/YdcC